jgi:predicted MFS family arabinose efflux permease
MAYHGLMGNLGIAAAPVIAIGAAETLGWRWAYVFLALLSVVSVLLARSLPDTRRAGPSARATGAAGGGWGRLAVPLLLTYVAYILTGFVYRGGLTFLPLRIEENVRFSVLGAGPAVVAASFLTAALLCGAVGQLMGASLMRRLAPEHVAVLLVVALVPSLALTGALQGPAIVLVAGAFTFFHFAAQPVWNVLIAEYTPEHLMGRSFGITFFAAFGLGSFAASFAGYFAEGWGTGAVFYALSGTTLLALGLALVLLQFARARQRSALAADVA